MDAQNAVQIVNPDTASDEHQSAQNLDDELGTVADADEVVGHAGELQNHDGTESECQRTGIAFGFYQNFSMAQ